MAPQYSLRGATFFSQPLKRALRELGAHRFSNF